ncbi:hypothetical protein BJV74DRAFT_392928 [Russula compacta]|nr:hypothetical protein BJV74DRAFT_392928 [Russula compacta]
MPKQLKAAAGPSSLADRGETDDDSEADTQLVSIPPASRYRDPLHLLLNYVAERAFDCDIALVHDDDLARIVGIWDGTSLEGLQPDVMMGRLRKSNLDIHQALCDLSSTKQSSIPATESTEFVRVATLSVLFHNLSPAMQLTTSLTSQKLGSARARPQRQCQSSLYSSSLPSPVPHPMSFSVHLGPSTAGPSASSGWASLPVQGVTAVTPLVGRHPPTLHTTFDDDNARPLILSAHPSPRPDAAQNRLRSASLSSVPIPHALTAKEKSGIIFLDSSM